MLTIYKYILADEMNINMLAVSKVCADIQGDDIYIWVMINTDVTAFCTRKLPYRLCD